MHLRISFIGLGVMGYPMAGHLARAGHHVTVYNRSPEKAQTWVEEYGGRAAPTPVIASQNAQIVCCCVGNDDDLRSVTIGEKGAFSSMPHDSIFVDHTTASADIARILATEGKKHGISFIDAPVSGGQAGAKNGTLTIMCGGEQKSFDFVAPVLAAYAQAITLIGPSGAGQLAKMVNQICIAGILQSLAEGIAFGKRAGLDMERVLAAIGQGAGASWQMNNRGTTMLQNQFDFGFAVDWMRKDLGLCLAEAKRNGALLPNTALIDQFYSEIQNMAGGRWDTSSLIKRLI